ncbi:MAG: LysE family translocator [Paracoccaceae bacterium]
MEINQLSALVAFAFVMSATPGPNNLMLMASGANFGWARTLPHMLGIGVGFVIMTLLVGVGLVQVFDIYPMIYSVLKYGSIGFLIYLAAKIANAAPPGHTYASATPMTFLQAALFQWVNPKAWSMALTAISVYAPQEGGIIGVVTVALAFGLVSFPSNSIWVLLGTQLRRLLNVPWKLRVFNLTAAMLLLASLYPILIPQG